MSADDAIQLLRDATISRAEARRKVEHAKQALAWAQNELLEADSRLSRAHYELEKSAEATT